MSKRGLGKGLDALLSTSSLARERQQAVNFSQELSGNGQLTELSVNQLQTGVYQPRKGMEAEALEELAASIRISRDYSAYRGAPSWYRQV